MNKSTSEQKVMAMEPTFDETIGEWVAVTLTGCEVYGQTRMDCEDHLREANRVVVKQACIEEVRCERES